MNSFLPIILAAGKCTRFYPYADEKRHKSMFFLAGKPILEYTLKELKKSGCDKVVIVVNAKDEKIRNYFKDGQKLKIKIYYAIQKEAIGMGDALLCAKDYIEGDFLLLNANQINISQFIPNLLTFKKQKKCAGVLVGKKESGGIKYGVFKLKNDRVERIIEKPQVHLKNIKIIKNKKDDSEIRVVGIYFLNKNFLSLLEKLKRKENSLEEALNQYFLKNDVRVFITEQETFSLKYPWDLFKIKNHILNNLPDYISKKAQIKKGALILGKNVYIEENAIIYEKAIIKGPCYIGKNAQVGNFAFARNGCDIEEGVIIGSFAEVKNSIFMKKSSMHSGFFGDSILGQNSHLGAGFISANKRFHGQNVKVVLAKGEKIDSKLYHLGTFIGSNVNIGVQSATMPGIIIGNDAIVYPGQKIFQNVSDGKILKDNH